MYHPSPTTHDLHRGGVGIKGRVGGRGGGFFNKSTITNYKNYNKQKKQLKLK